MSKIDIPHSTSVQNTSADQPLQFTVNEVITLDNSKVFSFNGQYLVLDIGTVIDKEAWLSEDNYKTTFAKRWITSIEQAKDRSFEDNTLYVVGGDPDLQQVIYMNNNFLNQTVQLLDCISLASAVGLIDWNLLNDKITKNTEDIQHNNDLILENVTKILENEQAIADNKSIIDINTSNLLGKQLVNSKFQFYLNASDPSDLFLDNYLPISVAETTGISLEFDYNYSESIKIEGSSILELSAKGTGDISIQLLLNNTPLAPVQTIAIDDTDFSTLQIYISDLFINAVSGDILKLNITLTAGITIQTGDKYKTSVMQLIPSGSLARFFDEYGGDNIPPAIDKVYSSEKIAELLATKEDKLFGRTLFLSDTNKLIGDPTLLVNAEVEITQGNNAVFSTAPATQTYTVNGGQVVDITLWIKSNNNQDKVYTVSIKKSNGTILGTTTEEIQLPNYYTPRRFVITITNSQAINIGESLQLEVGSDSNSISTINSGSLENVSYLTFQINSGSYDPNLDLFLPVNAPYYQIVGQHPEPQVLYPNTVWEKLYDGESVTVRTGGLISDENRDIVTGIQDDAMQKLTGRFAPRSNGSFSWRVYDFVQGVFGNEPLPSSLPNKGKIPDPGTVETSGNQCANFDNSRQARTSSETRMKNVLWNIWIRRA